MKRQSLFSALTVVLTFLSLLAVENTGHAASGTWTNTASGGLWDTTTNWSGGTVANGDTFTANFNTIDITADNTVHLNSSHTISTLIFGDTATGTAAGWTLDNNGNAANVLTLGTTPTITVNALGTGKVATISANIAGTNGLTKNGAGVLTLSGANTYSGTTIFNGDGVAGIRVRLNSATGTAIPGNLTHNAWILIDNANNQFGASTVITFNGNNSTNFGVIELQGYNQTVAGIIGVGSTPGYIENSQLGTSIGPSTFTINTLNASDNFSYTGVIRDQVGVLALTKSGPGAQTLAGANPFTGATTVNGGTLTLGVGGSASNTTSISIASGALMNLSGTANNQIQSAAVSPSLTVAGTLRVTQDQAHTLYATTITLNNGTLDSTGGTASGAAGNKAGQFGAFFASANRTITANGASNVISGNGGFGIASGAVLTLNTPLATDALLGSATFGLGNSGAPGGLSKTGLGTVTLTAANGYTGATNVNGGTLTIGVGGNLNSTSSITVASGATLNASSTANNTFFNRPLIVNGRFNITTEAANTQNASVTLSGGTIDTGSATGVNNTTFGALLFSTNQQITANGAGNVIQGTNNSLGIGNGSAATLTLSTPLTADALTISGKIINGTNVGSIGNLSKSGAGTVTLSAANTYNGTTTVNGGTLRMSGVGTPGNPGSALVVNSPGTLDLNGTSQNVGLFSGSGTIDNTSASPATFIFGNTATGSGVFSGLIQQSGGGVMSVTKANLTTETLSGTLNTFTGTLQISNGALILNSLKDSGAGSNGTGSIITSNASNTATLQYQGGATTITRDILITPASLTQTTGGGAVLDSSGTGALVINANVVGPASNIAKTVTLQGTNNATIGGAISNGSGTVSLTKTGADTWTLSGANTFSGATTINNGGLTVSGSLSGTAIGFTGAAAGTQLNVTAVNGLTGATSLAVNNTNAIAILSSANNYSGATTLSAGTLRLAAGGAMASSAFTMSGSGPATLQLRSDSNATFSTSGSISGFAAAAPTAGIYAIDVNQLTGAGANKTLTLGNFSINSGQSPWIDITGGNGYGLALGNFTSPGAFSVTFNPTTANVSVGAVTLTTGTGQSVVLRGSTTGNNSIGAISGNFGVAATGNWTLTAPSPYTGIVWALAGGTINFSDVNQLGIGGAGNGSYFAIQTAGTMRYTGTGVGNAAARDVYWNSGNATIDVVSATGDLKLNITGGTLGGTAADNAASTFFKTGPGTLTLATSGANVAMSKPVALNAGTLALQANATNVLQIVTKMTGASGTAINVLAGTGAVRNDFLTADWSANLADLDVASGGTFDIRGNKVTVDALTGGGSITNSYYQADSGIVGHTLTVGVDNGSGAFSGVISGTGTAPAVPGEVALVKTGAGTQTLTGINTYSGTTTVQAGTLVVNGSIASSSLTTVQSGATLMGTGTVGALTINAGGTLAPGNSPGIINSGTYNQMGTLALEIAPYLGTPVAGTDYDQLNVTGTVNLGGPLSVSYTGAPGTFNPAFAEKFTIVNNDNADAVTGTFTGLTAGTGVSVDGKTLKVYYDQGTGNDVVLISTNVAAAPITLYVDGSFTTPSTVDGDRELAGQQSAYGGTNAFDSVTTALANYSGADKNIILNGGTYASAALAGSPNVNLFLVQDGPNSPAENNVRIQSLSGDSSDGIILNYHGNGFGNLTVESGAFAGVISGNGTLTKDGGGTLTLSGPNTYSGTTTISVGVLNIQNSTALGNTINGTTVASGAALELQGSIAVGNEALSLAGTGVGGNGALRNVSGTNSWGGLITLGGATEIQSDAGLLTLSGGIANGANSLTFDGAGNTTVSGAIGAGSGTITKNGAGTLHLSAANTFTGATTVNAGTLQLTGTLQNASVAVTGGTFQQTDGTNNVTGSGTGNLTVTGGGRYQLQGGTLNFGDYNSGDTAWSPSDTSTINLETGSQFEFTGGTLLNVSNISVGAGAGTFEQRGGNFYIGQNGIPVAALTTINGGFSLFDGTLHFDVFGTDATPEQCCDGVASNNDQLTVEGDALLDSLVSINYVPGFTPVFGEAFTLLCADSITLEDGFAMDGGFFRVVPTGLGPGFPQFALQAIVPEPASVAAWSLISVICAVSFWSRRRRITRRG